MTASAPAVCPGPAAGRWGRLAAALRRIDPYLVLVVLLPLGVLAYYRSWLVTFPCDYDPWYSVSYFLDLPGSLRVTENYYVSDRLAYFVPGSVVYHLLPPWPANHVLHLAYYLAAVVSTYVTVSGTLGRRTALVAAFVLGGYWHFLREIGWSYVDGAAIAYTLLAAAALTRAGLAGRRWPWMLAAGFWFAAAVDTNFFLLEAALPLALYHVGACRIRGTLRRLGWDLASFAGGVIGLLLPLGAYFYSVTGHLLFSASARFAWGMVRASSDRSTVEELGWEVPPFAQWFKADRWLDLPLVVLAAALCYLAGLAVLRWRKRAAGVNPFATLFQVIYVVHFAVLAACEAKGVHMLLICWYAIYLVPVMILALAGQVARAVGSLRHATVGVLCVAGLWLAFDLCRLPPDDGLFQTLCRTSVWRYSRVLCLQGGLLAALGGVMAAGLGARRGPARAAALAVLLAAVALFNYTRSMQDVGSFRFRKNNYLAIFDGIDAIRREGLPLDAVQFWYHPQDYFDATLYRSLNAACLWGYSLYGQEYPEIPRATGQPVAPRRPVVAVLTRQPGAFATARERLRAVGVDAELLREQPIRHGQVAFTLTLIRCKPAPATGGRP